MSELNVNQAIIELRKLFEIFNAAKQLHKQRSDEYDEIYKAAQAVLEKQKEAKAEVDKLATAYRSQSKALAAITEVGKVYNFGSFALVREKDSSNGVISLFDEMTSPSSIRWVEIVDCGNQGSNP